jgi:UDP-glucose 4-epimerase
LEKIINENKSLILNCGYGKGFSVLRIVRFFEKILKTKIKIVYKKKRRGDIEEIYSDNYLLKKIFKIKIFTPISDIINSHLNWAIFRKKLR